MIIKIRDWLSVFHVMERTGGTGLFIAVPPLLYHIYVLILFSIQPSSSTTITTQTSPPRSEKVIA